MTIAGTRHSYNGMYGDGSIRERFPETYSFHTIKRTELNHLYQQVPGHCNMVMAALGVYKKYSTRTTVSLSNLYCTNSKYQT